MNDMVTWAALENRIPTGPIGDVLNDDRGELLAPLRMRIENLLAVNLFSDSTDHIVPCFNELLDYVTSHKGIGSRDESRRHCVFLEEERWTAAPDDLIGILFVDA
jgi:hypothetical protein